MKKTRFAWLSLLVLGFSLKSNAFNTPSQWQTDIIHYQARVQADIKDTLEIRLTYSRGLPQYSSWGDIIGFNINRSYSITSRLKLNNEKVSEHYKIYEVEGTNLRIVENIVQKELRLLELDEYNKENVRYVQVLKELK